MNQTDKQTECINTFNFVRKCKKGKENHASRKLRNYEILSSNIEKRYVENEHECFLRINK